MTDRSEAGEAATDVTAAERLDRNTVELLNELRIAGTGIQVMFAFLLSFRLTLAGSRQVDSFERNIYFVTLLLIALAAVLLLAPPIHHRLLFRHGEKGFSDRRRQLHGDRRHDLPRARFRGHPCAHLRRCPRRRCASDHRHPGGRGDRLAVVHAPHAPPRPGMSVRCRPSAGAPAACTPAPHPGHQRRRPHRHRAWGARTLSCTDSGSRKRSVLVRIARQANIVSVAETWSQPVKWCSTRKLEEAQAFCLLVELEPVT